MAIKQQGGVFGRNPTFNDVEVVGLTVTNTIGVNTPNPQRALDVLAGASNTGVAHFSGSFSDRGLFLSTAVGGSRSDGAVKYDASSGASGSTGQHQFLTDGGLVATVKSVGIALENGKGIDFSATSGTGTSELFNDYEEGTWTPTFSVEFTTAPTVTSAQYTKIGRKVTVTMLATDGVVTAGGSIGGLPFSSNASQGAGAYGGNSDTTESLQGTVGQSASSITNIPARTLTGDTWQITATYFT